jgi:hypothetical protein
MPLLPNDLQLVQIFKFVIEIITISKYPLFYFYCKNNELMKFLIFLGFI